MISLASNELTKNRLEKVDKTKGLYDCLVRLEALRKQDYFCPVPSRSFVLASIKATGRVHTTIYLT